ncbi:unnamed protein product, partial [Mesorhabditis spiculigera]
MNMPSQGFRKWQQPGTGWVAGLSSDGVLVWDTSQGNRVSVINPEEAPIAVLFRDSETLITVSATGNVIDWPWKGKDIGFVRGASQRVTANIIQYALHNSSSNRCCVVMNGCDGKKGAHCIFGEISFNNDASELKEIGQVPADLTAQQSAVGDGFFAYIKDRTLYGLTFDNSKMPRQSSYTNKARFAGRTTEEHHFFDISSCGNSIAVSTGYGRVFIWQNVMPKFELGAPTESVHWHSTSPMVALGLSGVLYSLGKEGTLLKYSSARNKPSFHRTDGLPQHLHISPDGALLALLKEDNSVSLINTAAFAQQAVCEGFYHQKNMAAGLKWFADFSYSSTIASSYAPGMLQWVNAFTGITEQTCDATLENLEIRSQDSCATYCSINDVFLAGYAAATLESRVNWTSPLKRIRIWERRSNLHLIETFSVDEATIAIAGCSKPLTQEDQIFVAATADSKITVYHSSRDGSGKTVWVEDLARRASWQQTQFLGCSSILPGGYWVSLHSTSPTSNIGCAVIWDLSEMRPIEAIPLHSSPQYVEWATESIFIVGLKEKVFAFDRNTLKVVWLVEESLPMCASLDACFVMDGRNVLRIEPSTCRILESLVFPKEIESVVLRQKPDTVSPATCLIAKARDGSLFRSMQRKSFVRAEGEPKKQAKTPFAALSATGDDGEDLGLGYRPASEAKLVKPLKLFDAPAHLLPPVWQMAPHVHH